MSNVGLVKDGLVNDDDLKLAFAQSQRVDSGNHHSSVESDFPEIIFSEFLEAVARVSLKFYDTDATGGGEDVIAGRALTSQQKIIKGIGAVVNLGKAL